VETIPPSPEKIFIAGLDKLLPEGMFKPWSKEFFAIGG
jgi:hypothetical protein